MVHKEDNQAIILTTEQRDALLCAVLKRKRKKCGQDGLSKEERIKLTDRAIDRTNEELGIGKK